MRGATQRAFLRMFSSALASQVLLSAASFVVGLLLIRHSSDLQYGSYILVSGAILLASSLQTAFIAPAMINRMMSASPSECGELTGGLYRERRVIIGGGALIALLVALLLWASGVLDIPDLLLTLVAIVAIVLMLRREYFRMVLLAYRHSPLVLRGDLLYATLLVLGVILATFSSMAAAAAVLAVALAALLAGTQLSRALRRTEPWDAQGAPGILREIARLGAWSTAGAAIHWSVSQGYTVLVAATLDVSAIAAVAATRLLAMPVNLLSSGIGSLMLPLTSRWLVEHGAGVVLRRLLGFALVIGCLAIGYFLVLWLLRDWVFTVLLKKDFAQRDLLLMLWSACFVLMALHQQLLHLLVARQRFRALTALALLSATLALSSSWWSMQFLGGAGAPLGIVIGEFINCVGVIVLCRRETRTRGTQTPAGSLALTS